MRSSRPGLRAHCHSLRTASRLLDSLQALSTPSALPQTPLMQTRLQQEFLMRRPLQQTRLRLQRWLQTLTQR
jgi:hypothetical protein